MRNAVMSESLETGKQSAPSKLTMLNSWLMWIVRGVCECVSLWMTVIWFLMGEVSLNILSRASSILSYSFSRSFFSIFPSSLYFNRFCLSQSTAHNYHLCATKSCLRFCALGIWTEYVQKSCEATSVFDYLYHGARSLYRALCWPVWTWIVRNIFF